MAKLAQKAFWDMDTAELREATRKYDKEMPGLPGKPLTAADRKLHAQAGIRGKKPRVGMKTKKGQPVPMELVEALRIHPGATAAFEAMSASHQAQYVKWVGEAKNIQTRVKRATQAAKMMQEWAARRTSTSD